MSRTFTSPRTSSHDLPSSPALNAFMSTAWTPTPLPADARVPSHDLTPARRARVAARFPGERLIIPAGALAVRSYDTDHRFRPHTAYAWLTGLTGEEQAGHVLVLEPDGDARHEAVLYLRPRSPRTGEEFYRDRRYGEFWVGRRPELEEAARMTGIRCAPLDAWEKLLTGPQPPTRVLDGVDPAVDEALRGRRASPAARRVPAQLASVLSELRLVKDRWEQGELQRAVDATTAGFEDVVRALPRALGHARGERWVEGVFNLRARLEGNGPGYHTIAAGGANACVLHWIRNDAALANGELLLLDAGVEMDSLYTADITRTLPVSGRFTLCSAPSTIWCWPPRTRVWPLCAPARASATSIWPPCGCWPKGCVSGVCCGCPPMRRSRRTTVSTAGTRSAAAGTCSAWTFTTARSHGGRPIRTGCWRRGRC